MARQPNPGVELVADAPLNGKTLLVQQNQAAEHNLQVVRQFGDGLPYERERVINEARFFLSNAAEAMLEAGKRLIEIKEIEGHGEFIRICEERLGLSERTARQLVQASLKYLSPALEKHSAKLHSLGKSKLIELMTEDDEDLAGLAEGGTVAGLELDDVERMSCRELRKALRETREDKAAQGRVMADITAKNNDLATKLAKQPLVQVLAPDEEAKQLRQEVCLMAFEVEALLLGKVREGFNKLVEHNTSTGMDHQLFKAGLVAHLDAVLGGIRMEFGLPAELDSAADFGWLNQQAQES